MVRHFKVSAEGKYQTRNKKPKQNVTMVKNEGDCRL